MTMTMNEPHGMDLYYYYYFVDNPETIYFVYFYDYCEYEEGVRFGWLLVKRILDSVLYPVQVLLLCSCV